MLQNDLHKLTTVRLGRYKQYEVKIPGSSNSYNIEKNATTYKSCDDMYYS